MNEPTIYNMVERLDCLERENCWLKRIVALVLVVIATVVLMGQAKSSKVAKVIEAEKFVVRISTVRSASNWKPCPAIHQV